MFVRKGRCGPVTRDRLPVPRIGDITPEWLTAALRTNDDLADVQVESVLAEPFGVGMGVLSDVGRIVVTYASGTTAPPTFVIKASTSNEANRPAVEAFDFYRREIAFYRDVAHLTTMRSPRSYYGDVDDANESILIMQDMQGYTPGDHAAGASREVTEGLVRQLAALHGPLWGRVDVPPFDAVPFHRSTVHGDNYVNFAPAMWEATARNHPTLIPPELAANRQRFLDAILPLQEWLTSEPRTFVHGDFRLGNILFSDVPGEPAVVIDWQTAQRSKGILDVAYLLSLNLRFEDRREWEHEIVDLYCSELTAYGVDYDPAVAFEDYKKASTYIWVCALYAGSVDVTDGAGSAWLTKMVERSAIAIVDFNGFQYL